MLWEISVKKCNSNDTQICNHVRGCLQTPITMDSMVTNANYNGYHYKQQHRWQYLRVLSKLVFSSIETSFDSTFVDCICIWIWIWMTTTTTTTMMMMMILTWLVFLYQYDLSNTIYYSLKVAFMIRFLRLNGKLCILDGDRINILPRLL